MPGLLSWVVTVIRDSKFEASDVFPGPGSTIRHPLSVFPSLHRVPRDQFPGFISTMRVLRLPAAHPTALRFLRLAVPRLHSLRSLLGSRVHRRGLELVTRVSSRDVTEEATGSPKFLENLNCPFAHVPIRRRQDCLHQTIQCSNVALGHRKAKAPTKGLSALNSMASGLAVYASPSSLPPPTQDSLPVAGQALPDGLFTRKVPMKNFRSASYISSPFPKLSCRNRCDPSAQQAVSMPTLVSANAWS
jgi:hypothetical protein